MLYVNSFVVGVTVVPATFTTISSAVNASVVVPVFIPECVSVIFKGIVIVLVGLAFVGLEFPFFAITGTVLSK